MRVLAADPTWIRVERDAFGTIEQLGELAVIRARGGTTAHPESTAETVIRSV